MSREKEKLGGAQRWRLSGVGGRMRVGGRAGEEREGKGERKRKSTCGSH